MSRSYGSARYDAGKKTWELSLSADAMGRFKRVFPKIPPKAMKVASLSDTTANARDLLWALDRYPLVMSAGDLAHLRRQSSRFKEQESVVDRMLAAGYVPRQFDMALPPREYQRLTADLCIGQGFLLCADHMGVGKTASGICLFADAIRRPALIIVPTHLPPHWVRQIDRFLPGLKIHTLKNTKPYDLTLDENGKPGTFPDVVITSYSKMTPWAPVLAELGVFKTLIFDEIQALIHDDTARYAGALHLRDAIRYRLGLSGTPMHNQGIEVFNVLNLLGGDAIGTKAEFSREHCGGGKHAEDPKALGLVLRRNGWMVRRTAKEVGRELPALTKIIQPVEADLHSFEKISEDVIDLATTILRSGGTGLDKMQASGDLDWRLREATGIAKCLAPGTRIRMADGSSKVVEAIRTGDELLGPDGQPRRVLATTQGHGEMYEVSSTARRPLFAPYVVNGNHILALKHSGAVRNSDRGLFGPYIKGDHVEVSVSDYLRKSAHFRRMLKGYKQGVEFPSRQLRLDPYFLGLWLGDGTSASAAVTTADSEIVRYLSVFASKHNLVVRTKAPGRTAPTYCIGARRRGADLPPAKRNNPVISALRDIGVLGNKHIPQDYLISSRSQRMSLLAGLIDSDGHRNISGGYTIATQWQHLSEQMCSLAASLGFASTSALTVVANQTGKTFIAYKVGIYGNGLEHLPLLLARKKTPPRKQRKDPLRSGIAVRPVGLGEFYGFELDGDGLFLLHDYTVTHNSPHVAAFVKMLLESDTPVILSGWHRAVYDVWMDLFKAYKPMLYTGTETLTQKEASRAAFITGKTNLLIISNRSGSGLDGLQERGSTAVVGELDWTPAYHDQFICRLHRDGQVNPVFAHYLVSDVGSDPVLADILGLKRAQIDGICDPDLDLIEKLQGPQERMKHLAAAWLAKHRPEVLTELEAERVRLAAEAEQAKIQKLADREREKLERQAARGRS